MKKAFLILSMVWLAIAGTSFGQSLSTDWNNWQKDSPVQIISHNKSATHYVNGVLLFNSSQHDIAEVRLGWALLGVPLDVTKDPEPIAAFVGARSSLHLPAGATVAVFTQEASELTPILDLMERNAKKYEEFRMQIGVVEVRTAKRTILEYDLKAHGSFLRVADPRIGALAREAAKPKLIEEFNQESETQARRLLAQAPKAEPNSHIQRVALPSASAPMYFLLYYTCGSAQNPIYCTNNLSSCTETICSEPGACPNQKCDLMKSIE